MNELKFCYFHQFLKDGIWGPTPNNLNLCYNTKSPIQDSKIYFWVLCYIVCLYNYRLLKTNTKKHINIYIYSRFTWKLIFYWNNFTICYDSLTSFKDLEFHLTHNIDNKIYSHFFSHVFLQILKEIYLIEALVEKGFLSIVDLASITFQLCEYDGEYCLKNL